jgi:Flp pilus assembly protein TadD
VAAAVIDMAQSYLGRGHETEAHMQEALRLSPYDTSAVIWEFCIGLAKFYSGDDEGAAVAQRRAIETNRSFPLAHFYLAAALAQLGRQPEAEAAARAGLALDPSFTLARFQAGAASDNPIYLKQRARVGDGLRRAGVPEG